MHRFLEIPKPLCEKTGWPWTEETIHKPQIMPDISQRPKISIVTPSYNQAQYLEETIRSVLLQGYPNFEYIIIDGGSTDGSVEIIKKYETWLSYWISEKDRGQGHAVNKGIQKAQGDILLWLNSDDVCLPHAFDVVANAFIENPSVHLVIGQANVIDEQGKLIDTLPSKFTAWEDIAVLPTNSIRQVSTFFRRNLFDELGYVNEELHIAMDTELLVRFTKSYPPLIVDQFLASFRVHKNAKSHQQLILGYEENDRSRPGILNDLRLLKIYRENSAWNWLQQSKYHQYDPAARLRCLKNAIKNKPSIILVKSFVRSLKNLLVDSLSKRKSQDLVI